jgi:hypothetical protein
LGRVMSGVVFDGQRHLAQDLVVVVDEEVGLDLGLKTGVEGKGVRHALAV